MQEKEREKGEKLNIKRSASADWEQLRRILLFVSQLKINPLLCRGREDLQIKVKTRARIKVGLQTTKLTREVP